MGYDGETFWKGRLFHGLMQESSIPSSFIFLYSVLSDMKSSRPRPCACRRGDATRGRSLRAGLFPCHFLVRRLVDHFFRIGEYFFGRPDRRGYRIVAARKQSRDVAFRGLVLALGGQFASHRLTSFMSFRKVEKHFIQQLPLVAALLGADGSVSMGTPLRSVSAGR